MASRPILEHLSTISVDPPPSMSAIVPEYQFMFTKEHMNIHVTDIGVSIIYLSEATCYRVGRRLLSLVFLIIECESW